MASRNSEFAQRRCPAVAALGGVAPGYDSSLEVNPREGAGGGAGEIEWEVFVGNMVIYGNYIDGITIR